MEYNMMKLQLQTIVSFPSSDDNCLLIVGQTDHGSNQAFFLDINKSRVKSSKFNLYVGPINHWHGSRNFYKNMTVFFTENLEIFRFDHQNCDWSLINPAGI
jgi:hypothetical protein